MNNPKPGELWNMEVWSVEGNYSQTVLVLTNSKVLDKDEYGDNIKLFECLVNRYKQTLPIWMFNSAELISFKRV